MRRLNGQINGAAGRTLALKRLTVAYVGQRIKSSEAKFIFKKTKQKKQTGDSVYIHVT